MERKVKLGFIISKDMDQSSSSQQFKHHTSLSLCLSLLSCEESSVSSVKV